MAIKVVDETTIREHAQRLAKKATKRVWITSPWVRQRAANVLLRDLLPRIESDGLDVRIVYRVKEPVDLNITELEALKAYEEAGCKVRYSIRLHAKLVLVDDSSAIVSSSNLTPTGGYGWVAPTDIDWRNEELGILVENDAQALGDLEQEFTRIWDAATRVDERTLGIAMDFPTVETFNFVAIREVEKGQYVSTEDAEGRVILGRIAEITAYNRSFPQMTQSMWVTQGFGGAGEGRRTEIPDLQSLFSHPSKEHGFLVTKTFFEPESVFRIAKVEVLKHRVQGALRSPSVPVAPGADVQLPSDDLLKEMLGDGDTLIGHVNLHPGVPVKLRSQEIITKHLSVLGITGSGKSNAVKVLIRELLRVRSDFRIFVIDTHGEYADVASQLAPSHVMVDVELRELILRKNMVMTLAELDRDNGGFRRELERVYDDLGDEATLDEFLNAVEAVGTERGDDKFVTFVENARERNDLCLREDEGARIVAPSGSIEDPGLYILNLRTTTAFVERVLRAGALMRSLFDHQVAASDCVPTLVVLEEAHNYIPEQGTGQKAEAKPAHAAARTIASEGRKFELGLIVASQRPARVSKEILSQCNSQMVFRVASAEDLGAVGSSFEAATKPLVDALPGFDVGVCIAGGSMLDMVVHTQVPLLAAELAT